MVDGDNFHFYSNFRRTLCIKIVQILIRRRVLHRLKMSHKKDASYGLFRVAVFVVYFAFAAAFYNSLPAEKETEYAVC